MFKKPPYPIYVADVQKMSVPRLSFRSPPLKIKIRKPPQHKPLPEPIPDIESQELPPAPKSNNKIMYFVIIIILLVSLRIISMVVFKTKKHTIKKLKCNQKQNGTPASFQKHSWVFLYPPELTVLRGLYSAHKINPKYEEKQDKMPANFQERSEVCV